VSARIVAALVVALALLSGVLIGIASDRLLLLPFGHRFHAGPPRGGPSAPGFIFGPPDGARQSGRIFEPSAEWVTDRLTRELDLTPEQRVRVDSIVTRRMAQRREIMTPVRERMRQLFDSTRTDVEAVLTPAQRATFDKLRTSRGDGVRGGGGPAPTAQQP
jgi:Spy/CpxP family protein refolding chaperone